MGEKGNLLPKIISQQKWVNQDFRIKLANIILFSRLTKIETDLTKIHVPRMKENKSNCLPISLGMNQLIYLY